MNQKYPVTGTIGISINMSITFRTLINLCESSMDIYLSEDNGRSHISLIAKARLYTSLLQRE